MNPITLFPTRTNIAALLLCFQASFGLGDELAELRAIEGTWISETTVTPFEELTLKDDGTVTLSTRHTVDTNADLYVGVAKQSSLGGFDLFFKSDGRIWTYRLLTSNHLLVLEVPSRGNATFHRIERLVNYKDPDTPELKWIGIVTAVIGAVVLIPLLFRIRFPH